MSPVDRIDHSSGSLEIAGFCQTVDLFQFNSVFSLIHSFHLLIYPARLPNAPER